MTEKGTCIHHENRNLTISDHGERIKAVEVEVQHMKVAHSDFLDRFDSATDEAKRTLKELCVELKLTNKKLSEVANEIKIGEIRRERKETRIGGEREEEESFSGSINRAWRHFQNNFAIVVIYTAAGAFFFLIFNSFFSEISKPLMKFITVTLGIK